MESKILLVSHCFDKHFYSRSPTGVETSPSANTFSTTADLSTSKVFNAEGSLHSRRTEQTEVGGCEEV